MATLVRVRRDVYKLAATDKTLEWYGKAINELKTRPIKDPLSWRYQAAEQLGAVEILEPVPARQLVFPLLAPRLPALVRADLPRRHRQAGRA
jgi:hypothetical protein